MVILLDYYDNCEGANKVIKYNVLSLIPFTARPFIGSTVILGQLGQIFDCPKMKSIQKNELTVNFHTNIGTTYNKIV